MSRDLIKKLNNLKQGEVKPREEWLKTNREILLSQIRNTMPSEKQGVFDTLWLGMSIFVPQKLVFGVVRPMAVLLIVALVGTSGWIATVDASYESLPGDWLYSAKRVVEKTQMVAASLVGSKVSETKLHSEFAKRRAAEIKQVVLGDDPQRESRAAETVADLKTEIKAVSDQLEEIKTTTEEGQAEAVQEIQKNADLINNDLKAAKDDLTTGTSTASKDLTSGIAEAKDLAKDAGVKAVEVLVAKHLEGDSSVSIEDVKEAIDNNIQSSVAEAAESKLSMEGVQIVVNAASTGVPVSSTPASEQLDAVVTQTNEATAKAQEAVVDLDNKVNQILALVETGDLNGALDMVKQASETTKAVEKIQDEAISSAQLVLPTPVVAVVKEQASTIANTVSTSETVTLIVSTTTEPIEPGKLPVTVTVTTTAITPPVSPTAPAVSSPAP